MITGYIFEVDYLENISVKIDLEIATSTKVISRSMKNTN